MFTLMSITPRPTRQRRTPGAVRDAAMAAARDLLIDGGPDAMTLKAVGERLGMSHANLIHHFGSAAGLQTAVMNAMLDDLTRALAARVDQVRSGELAPRAFVDVVFDAFDSGGAGRLAAWIALSHDDSRFDPVRPTLRAMADALRTPDKPREVSAGNFLLVALLALGDSLIGKAIRGELGLSADATRDLAARLLVQSYRGDPGAPDVGPAGVVGPSPADS
jgi:AcrR family transcriptional regulator